MIQFKGELVVVDSVDGSVKYYGVDYLFLSVCGNLKFVGNEG